MNPEQADRPAGAAPPAVAEFDAVAAEYEALHAENVKASGYTTAYFAEYKVREAADLLARAGRAAVAPLNILNFGCGIGNTEGFLRKYFPAATIYGVDVSAKSVELARERHRDLPRVHFSVYDGRALPWDFRFDVIFVANVLHHVPRAQHVALLGMLRAALAPDSGQLFLFEHNPWNPLTVRAVETCAFDRDAVLLAPTYAGEILAAAGFSRRRLRFTLFFPKALSALAPLEKFLRLVPLGAQYYVLAKP